MSHKTRDASLHFIHSHFLLFFTSSLSFHLQIMINPEQYIYLDTIRENQNLLVYLERERGTTTAPGSFIIIHRLDQIYVARVQEGGDNRRVEGFSVLILLLLLLFRLFTPSSSILKNMAPNITTRKCSPSYVTFDRVVSTLGPQQCNY